MFINAELKLKLGTFEEIMQLRGEVYRRVKNRCTQKIIIDDKTYFIKQHHRMGWKEILKNIFQLRRPICTAEHEWLALEKLRQLKIAAPEVVGYGVRGKNPASKQSFIITRALPPHVSLEEFCRDWHMNKPSFRLKLQLIKKVAHIARVMHAHGINHRDFYICHLLFDTVKKNDFEIYLIDLHRAQIRAQTPERWCIKDLASLYFSVKDIALTKRDLLRFISEYRKKSIRSVLDKEAFFWQKVKLRGDKLYQKHIKSVI